MQSINEINKASKHNIKYFSSDIAQLNKNLDMHSRTYLQNRNRDLQNLTAKVDLLDPKKVLKRGYSITYHKGNAVRDASRLNKGEQIVTELFEGKIASIVESTSKPGWKTKKTIKKLFKS
ncbi:MAG: exodeoxyribonuclease VII large subunit [Bacteroidota bacterium]|nr:exodeoxyribonuclease VII large subunit [Bacteroidota bacterium]